MLLGERPSQQSSDSRDNMLSHSFWSAGLLVKGSAEDPLRGPELGPGRRLGKRGEEGSQSQTPLSRIVLGKVQRGSQFEG